MPPATARITVEAAWLRLSDGTMLAADVYQAQTGEPCPALLLRTPYSRVEAAARIDAIRLARAGWLVVVQSVRGTGGSTGGLDPFAQEQADGAAAIRWSREMPGCDGRVAMTGASYEGIAQWYAARGAPAGLRAIFPRLCARSVRDYWFRSGGLLRQSFVQSWGLGLAYTDRNLTPKQRRRVHELADCREALYETPPRRSPLSALTAYYDHWLGPADAGYWEHIEPGGTPDLACVAVLQLTGWYDIFCEGAIADHASICARPKPGAGPSPPRRIIIGPWSHTSLPDQVTGTEDHGLAANGYASDVMYDGHVWLRTALNGEDCAGGAHVFLVGARRWLELPTWPPPALDLAFRLVAQSPVRLCGETSRLERDGGRTLDPLRPRSGPAVLTGRTLDRRDVQAFQTDVFAEVTDAAGTFEIDIAVQDGRGVDGIIATLALVGCDGRWTAHVEGGIDLRACRRGPVRASIASFALRIKPGERLGVVLALSQAPAYWDGPEDGGGTPYHQRWIEIHPSLALHVPAIRGRAGCRMLLSPAHNYEAETGPNRPGGTIEKQESVR